MHSVLITCDRLPASRVACYGAADAFTPQLDGLAAESLLLDRCYAADAAGLPGATAPFAPTRQAFQRWQSAGRSSGGSRNTAAVTLIASARIIEAAASTDGWGQSSAGNIRTVEVVDDSDRTVVQTALDCLGRGEPPSGVVWLALQGLCTGPPGEAVDDAAIAQQMQALDASIGEFLAEISDSGVAESAVVCGLAGEVVDGHPLIARGMPPLVDSLLQAPVWICDGEPESRGVRWGGLTRVGDVLATVLQTEHGAESVAAPAPLPVSERIKRLSVEEIVTRWDDRAIALRTPAERVILELQRTRLADEARGDDDAPRLWLFQKPDDVWDWCDLASQRPEVAEERRGRLLPLAQAARDSTD